MEQLPLELVLQIISYLPIRTIHVVQALSTLFNSIIKENANQVYRSAAFLHKFVGGQALKGNPVSALKHATRHYLSTWMDDVEDWRSFCKNIFMEEALWNGEKPKNLPSHSRVKTLEACGRTVRKFKVDEEEKTVISISQNGGLIVSSVDTQEVLWSLPVSYVREYTHLEYSNGFVVFNQPGKHIEVWRRSTDSMNPKTYIPSNPTASQIEACPNLSSGLFELHQQLNPSSSSAHSSEHHGSSINPSLSLPRRGAYLPFATLKNPQPFEAFRFSYPYLLLASQVLKQAFIWDVPYATLLEIVDISPPQGYSNGEHDAQAFNSVDISDEHIFICWTAVLCVYRWRITGPDQAAGDVVFTYPPVERSDGITRSYRVWDKSRIDETRLSPVGETVGVSYQLQDARWVAAESLQYKPTDVHVSPNGKDLVALINGRHLLYVPNFIKVAHNLAFGKPSKRHGIPRRRLEVPNLFMLECAWGCRHMAFDGKRVAVSTYNETVVLNLHDRRNIPSYRYPRKVKGREILPRVFRIQFELAGVTCLQITDTAIWTTGGNTPDWALYQNYVKVFDISDLKRALPPPPPPPTIRSYSQVVTKKPQKKI